jgi:hypothetical protein
MPHANTIANIVDETSGYHFPFLPPSGLGTGSAMDLSNANPSKYRSYSAGYDSANEIALDKGTRDSIRLNLMTYGALPTVNLADFNLHGLVVTSDPTYSNLSYSYTSTHGVQSSITASVNSITGVAVAPEPGSLTLRLFGIEGFAARGIRRGFR